MDMQTAIRTVTERRDLDAGQMTAVMRLIMGGDATPAQIGGFLIGLRMKGETVEEIAAAAAVMRELATHVTVDQPHLVDIVGTGGDGVGTFNVSTASAMVVAAAGGRVAKHGNRSISSSSGSADLLEQAGVRLDLTPEQVAACVDEVGVGFMFAPRHHGAMRHAVAPRREMAVRTIFNVLGPLTNPAGARRQLVGVYDDALVETLARVLGELGALRAMVVHSRMAIHTYGCRARGRRFAPGVGAAFPESPPGACEPLVCRHRLLRSLFFAIQSGDAEIGCAGRPRSHY